MEKARDELIPTRWSLIQRLKNWDDQESWREFFDTYWRLIYGTAAKYGLTDVEAQEVVQETVISVCRKIGGFNATPEAGSFKSWLLQMTRWRIKDQIRKRDSSKRRASEPTDTSATPTIERIPDPAGMELEKVWDEEWQANLISAALERVQRQVSAKHYQMFYLHVIRGVSAEKVAEAVEMNPSDVYVVKHRVSPIFEKAVKAVETNQR